MNAFFTRRAERMMKDGTYVIDITSNSTYSNMGGYAEWGYNRDGENLPQTEIVLVTDGFGIPIAFQMLPGSIADSASLQSIVEWMESIGVAGILVADCGFENAGNMAARLDRGIPLTIPSNARGMPIKKLMTKAKRMMKDSDPIRRHEGRTYRVAEFEVGIADLGGDHCYVTRLDANEKDVESENGLIETSRKIKAFVVHDPRKAAMT